MPVASLSAAERSLKHPGTIQWAELSLQSWVGYIYGARAASIGLTKLDDSGVYIVATLSGIVGEFHTLWNAKEEAMLSAADVPYGIIDFFRAFTETSAPARRTEKHTQEVQQTA